MTKINIQKLLTDYNSTKSARKASILNGISASTGYKYLKKAGAITDLVINSCIDRFFSTDTPESFYWAGFIAADGNLFIKEQKYKQLRIELSNIDYNHLIKFKKCINFSGKIEDNIKKNSCIITIISNKIFDDLERFNIVPQKNLTYKFPKWIIEHNLVNHFVRGMVDGDGSFFYKKRKDRKTYQLGFNIVGTKSTVESISIILSKNCKKIIEKQPSKCQKSYKIEYVGNNCVSEIRNFLYYGTNENIMLLRKHNKVVRNQNYTLGLDLSLNSTGFCILQDGNIVEDLVGSIKQNVNDCHGKKLSIIDNSIKRLIRKYRPRNIVIEDIFKGRNINTFKALAMVRGVAIMRFFMEGFEDRLTIISASSARKTINIGKSKEDAFKDIIKKYNLKYDFSEHNDLVDAIILCLACHEMEKQGFSEKDLKRKKKRRKRKKKK